MNRGRGRGRGRGGRGRGSGNVKLNPPPEVSTPPTAPAVTTNRTSRGTYNHNADRGRSDKPRKGTDFANLPTISRSGDVSGTGHELKDHKIQERYWAVIEDRVSQHWKKYECLYSSPIHTEAPNENLTRQLKESEDIILIHLRRIREGVSSAQRLDGFALKVYDMSISFAILCKNSVQTAAAMSHFPSAHIAYATRNKANEEDLSSTHPRCSAITVLLLTFHLSDTFPSQNVYYRHLANIPEQYLPRNSEGFTWISALRHAIHTRNFYQCDKLTQRPALATLCEKLGFRADAESGDEIHRTALLSVVDTLRTKIRESAWSVLRLSYRELRMGDGMDTAVWLSSILLLRSPDIRDDPSAANEWLQNKLRQGHVVKADDRWVIRRG